MKKLFFIAFVVLFVNTTNAQLAIGDQLPNVTLKARHQKDISLTAFKGKVLLVDFWASWCAPCRIANKKLTKLYHHADKSKFEIVGISVDNDTTKYLKAIDKDNLPYPQFIDPNGFDAKTAVLFGVEQLPASFLFDKTGRLVAINPTEEQINSAINNK